MRSRDMGIIEHDEDVLKIFIFNPANPMNAYSVSNTIQEPTPSNSKAPYTEINSKIGFGLAPKPRDCDATDGSVLT